MPTARRASEAAAGLLEAEPAGIALPEQMRTTTGAGERLLRLRGSRPAKATLRGPRTNTFLRLGTKGGQGFFQDLFGSFGRMGHLEASNL